MALYRRIFSPRDKKKRWGFRSARSLKKLDYNFSSPEVLASYKSWQAPEFDQGQIRLLVFNECDVKGRKLLFDSKAIKKKEQNAQSSNAKANPCMFSRRFGYNAGPKAHPTDTRQQQSTRSSSPNGDISNKYVFLRPSSDIKLLGEMMYGSVAMSYRGSTIKVHTIRSPPELMLSQVFVLRPKENLDQDGISLAPVELMVPQRTSVHSQAKESIAHSLPVAVPPSSTYTSLDDDSGVVSGSSSSFLTPFPSPGSSVSSNQSNSFHRRWMRNQVTSMEHGVRRKSSIETPTVEEPMNRRRYPKIGMGVVISLFEEGDQENRHFQTFFFSHFTLFESHFHRLYLAVEKALTYQRRMFIVPIMEALDEFRSAVYSLYCAPRIQRPIWLNMMTYQMQRGHLCEHLVHEIIAELEIHNSKQTNFFFSRLLTAVLMHHLAWVPTVIPAESAPSRAYLDKHQSTLLDMLAKSHPYNPLWAQLGDIFGAIGFPVKVAKTIIVGHRADVVCRLLYILSYFIRCSEVHEIPEHREQIFMEYDQKFQDQDFHLLNSFDETAEEKSAGRQEEKIPKTERVSSDSADSGLESSCERILDAVEEIDHQTTWSSDKGNGKPVDDAAATDQTLALKKPYLAMMSGDQNVSTHQQPRLMQSSVEAAGDKKSAERLGSVGPSGSVSTGSGGPGQGGSCPDITSLQPTGSQTQDRAKKEDRPLSGGLYPDLKTLLSGKGSSEEAVINGSSGVSTCQHSPPVAKTPVPSVQCTDVVELLSQCESVVAVGQGSQVEANIDPVILPRSFDATVLKSKREHEVSLGRMSVLADDQAAELTNDLKQPTSGLKVNPDELNQCASWPGHDRSSIAPRQDNQLTDLSQSQESIRTSANASPSLYPTVDICSLSLDVTPVPSTDNTDTESPDRTPPAPRRNKRFPLTSPLARAHQEYVSAQDLNLNQSDAISSESNTTLSSPQTPTTPTNNTSGITVCQPIPQTTPGVSKGPEAIMTPPNSRKQPPSSLNLGNNEGFPSAGTRGQQTTPVGCAGGQVKWSPIGKYHRCFSTGSNASSGYSDSTLIDHEELPMAFSEPVTPETDPGESYVDNFGRSLLGGYSQSYVSDMALHGVAELDRKQVQSDLDLALQHSVLDEDITEAVCIVADTDNWTVELLSSERVSSSSNKPQSSEVQLSECIYDLLESVRNMCHLRMPSDFCLMHLEDKLQEVYFKSTALASYLDQNPRAGPKELTTVLGFESSDLPLLLSIVSVHSPNIIKSILRESYDQRHDTGRHSPAE